MMTFRLTLFALLMAGATFSQTKTKTKYADGRELITAMYNKYAPDKWYRYFTFSQTLEFYRNDSVIRRDVWHEAYRPGGLIIKIGTKDSKSGRMYDNFTMYSFEDGIETQKYSRVHDLLVAGLDVFLYSRSVPFRYSIPSVTIFRGYGKTNLWGERFMWWGLTGGMRDPASSGSTRNGSICTGSFRREGEK